MAGESLSGFLMALANAWGLTLLILCLGFGLVEVPRVFWRQSSNVVNLRYCEFKAVEVHDDLKESRIELKDVVREVLDYRRLLDQNEFGEEMEHVVELCPIELVDEVTSSTQRRRHREEEGSNQVSYSGMCLLHKRIKTALVEHRRAKCSGSDMWNA